MALIGADRLRQRLTSLSVAVKAEIGPALVEQGTLIMTEAKRRCPMSPGGGELRASGRVSEPEVIGNDVRVQLSFGGPDAPYAVSVHERLGRVHSSTPGTGPKYLEGPVLEAKATLAARLAARLDLRVVLTDPTFRG